MNKKPTILDRALRLFTDVRAGEGPTALMMFLNVFLILCAYYFIKPLREGWLAISDIGGESADTPAFKTGLRAATLFVQSLILIPVVWAFGWFSDRSPRRKLIVGSTLFFMVNMVVFWALQPEILGAKLRFTGIVFYIWVGIFGVFIVAQFWAFAADIFSREQGERLLPMIAIGATGGAALGSWISGNLPGVINKEWLLLAGLVPLAISILLTVIVDRRQSRSKDPTEAAGGNVPQQAAEKPKESHRNALRLVLSNRFLLAVALITILLNWVSNNSDHLIFKLLQEAIQSDIASNGIEGKEEIDKFTGTATATFYGGFFFWINIGALVLQALVASRILKWGGFGVLFLIMPVVALFTFGLIALIPALAVATAMQTAVKATDFSLNNTARHVLWLPLSSELIYKGKPMIDSLFIRIGGGLGALSVLCSFLYLDLTTRVFCLFNLGLVILWIAFAIYVIREHRKLSEKAEHKEPTP